MTIDGSGETSLLDRAVAAIEWYRAQGHSDPSSVTGAGAIGLLEATMAARLGVAGCLAVSSCTSALRVALEASGVGPGTEVLILDTDWPAAAAATAALGGTPRSAPPPRHEGDHDPDAVGHLINGRTAAVVVTHPAEGLAPVHDLVRHVELRGVSVIEDAARALSARIRPGARAQGRFTCFSFGPGKDVDAGEGGILAVRDSTDLDNAVALSQHPTRCAFLGIDLDHATLNHRINPLSAVIALHEIQRIRPAEPG